MKKSMKLKILGIFFVVWSIFAIIAVSIVVITTTEIASGFVAAFIATLIFVVGYYVRDLRMELQKTRDIESKT